MFTIFNTAAKNQGKLPKFCANNSHGELQHRAHTLS